MNNKIILYGIFYVILTSFFLYIFKNEKKIAKNFSKYTDSFSDNIITKFNVENEKTQRTIKKGISLIENIIVALVLVVVIQRFYIGNFVIPTGSMIPTIEVGDRIFADMVSYKFRLPRREEIIVFKEPIENKVLYTKRAMGLPGEKITIKNNKLYINDNVIESRQYSNWSIGDSEWIIPKKGDKLEIIPTEKFPIIYKSFKEFDWNVYEVQKDMYKASAFVGIVMKELKFVINGNETGMILDFIHDDEILKKLNSGEKVEITLKDDYFVALGDNTDNSSDSRIWGFVASNRIRGRGLVRFWPLNRIGIVK